MLKFLDMVDTKSNHFINMCNMYVKRQRMTFLLEHMCAYYCKQKVISDKFLKQDDKENIAKGRQIRDTIEPLLFKIKDQRIQLQEIEDFLFEDTGIVDLYKLFLNKSHMKTVEVKKPPSFAYWLMDKYSMEYTQKNTEAGVQMEQHAA